MIISISLESKALHILMVNDISILATGATTRDLQYFTGEQDSTCPDGR
jgi:hypothetical protein